MTTAQEPLAGPSVPSFFKSVLHDLARIVIPSPHESHLVAANVSQQEQLCGVNRAELSSANNVQRDRGAHSALRTPSPRISSEPSPQRQAELRGAKDDQRCQFTFSDGRQCRHQRAQLCPQHALRAENDPLAKDEDQNISLSPPKEAALQSPELEAVCADLTTATNINRALTQVFLLLAQGRISQKQAVAFGYLSQLLLQTVPGIRSEFVSAFGYSAWEANLKPKVSDANSVVIPSSGESHLPPRRGYPQDALFAGNTVELSPGDKVNPSEESLRDQRICPTPANPPPAAPRSAPPPERPIRANIPGVPFDRPGKAQILAPLPAQKRAAPPAPSAAAMTVALTSESSAFRPETSQIQMPSADSSLPTRSLPPGLGSNTSPPPMESRTIPLVFRGPSRCRLRPSPLPPPRPP